MVFCNGCQSLPSRGFRDDSYSATRLKQAAFDLSWDSLDGDKKGFTTLYPAGDAARFLWQTGTPATPALISSLEDTNRGVAAHIILTYIYHRDRITPKLHWIYAATERGPVGVILTVNGLSWTERWDPNFRSVRRDDLKQNAARWRSELQNRSR